MTLAQAPHARTRRTLSVTLGVLGLLAAICGALIYRPEDRGPLHAPNDTVYFDASSLSVPGSTSNATEYVAAAAREEQAAGESLQVAALRSAADATVRNCSATASNATHGLWKRSRYVVAENVKPGYGLTNQLMVYAGMAAFATMDSALPSEEPPTSPGFDTRRPRRILLPRARIHGTVLVNFSRSLCVGCGDIVTDPCEEAFADSRRSKPRHLRTIIGREAGRGAVDAEPAEGMAAYGRAMARERSRRTVVLWDMYRRWPFGAEPLNRSLHGWFCGLDFADPIQNAAKAVVAALERQGHRRYASLHLRLEPQDLVTMGRNESTPAHLTRFFLDVVVPAAHRAGATAVVVHSGPLRRSTWAALQHACQISNVDCPRKDALLPKEVLSALPQERVASPLLHGDQLIRPTRASHAAVDAEIAVRATLALLTAFSSFTTLVAARRCCSSLGLSSPLVPGRATATEIYDVFPSGQPSSATAPYTCGVAIPPYMVSADLRSPTSSEDVFRPVFDPASPLAQQSAH